MTKVLIIGNSDSVYKCSAGYLVDSYDVVVRVNRFQIKGCEAFVGNKITHWAIFPCHAFLNHLRDHLNDGHIPIEPHKVKIWWRHESQKYAENMKKQVMDKLRTPQHMINKIPQDIITDLSEQLEIGAKGPSTGLTAIYWAIKKWKQNIDILGFGINDKFIEDYYCKWEPLKDHYASHDMQKERELLTDWEKIGKIRRLENVLISPAI